MSRVLVVDDDHPLRLLYAEELSDEGYETALCGDVSDVMGIIGQIKPDVMVMEIHLDKRDRWELLRRIRKTYPYMPVVLNTARVKLPVEWEVLADAHVLKSVDMRELKTEIRTLLNDKRPFQWHRAEPFVLPPHYGRFD